MNLQEHPSVRRLPDPATRERFRGCLLGGAVGDALGAPIEFLTRREIIARFGDGGLRDMATAYGRLGAITDDTQMMLFTAEGVMRSYVRFMLRGICHPPGVIANAYQRWLYTQGEATHNDPGHRSGWLIRHQALFACRAPGNTCVSALKAGVVPARNDRKGCGGVMRVAPVGMMCQALSSTDSAARDGNLRRSFDLACEAAGITHGHPTGKLASGVFSAIVFLLLEGKSLPEAVQMGLELLETYPDHKETSTAIRLAVQLALEQPNSFDALKRLGEGWVAEEALAIGIYCALCAKNFEAGVIMAVNHDGDSDSTGLIAGHLLGAIHGVSAIPKRWLKPLELRNVIEEVADDLATVGEWRLDDPEASAEGDYYFERYPGG